MAECRIRSAIEVAAGSPTYLGRLVAYALPNVDATRPEDLGKDAIEDAVADFTANESRSVFKWINMLALCAQISPMLGLFGTVQDGGRVRYAGYRRPGGPHPAGR